ncbi:MAG: hypothetical protein KDE14_09875, partial [Rhodobacteraceae bacterium]|nr:hypothetical protein [Paracoccaceae bacterium]
SLLTGRQDIAMGLNPDAIETVRAAGAKAYISIEPAVFGISFITFKPGPWQDVRVRRALNMAVDRQRIIDALLAGATVPTGQPAAHGVIGYDPDIEPYPYDPEAAKRLLAEAGYPDGFRFVLECATGIDPNDSSVYQQLQTDLAAVDVKMDITTMPPTQFFNALRLTDFTGDAFPVDWPSWPTMDVTRGVLAHSCERINPWYCDPGAMPLLVKARTTWDPDEALALKRELMRRYHDAAPAIFMYETANFVGLSERVAGFDIVNGTHISFETVTLSP